MFFSARKSRWLTPFLEIRRSWFVRTRVLRVPRQAVWLLFFFCFFFRRKFLYLSTDSSIPKKIMKKNGIWRKIVILKTHSVKGWLISGFIEHVRQISGSISKKRRGHWMLEKKIGAIRLNQPVRLLWLLACLAPWSRKWWLAYAEGLLFLVQWGIM